jgi:hypothetical protein
MTGIKNFKDFCMNESEADDLRFRRHNGDMGATYNDRAKTHYGLGADPTVLQRTGNFFDKMEDRFNNAATIYQTKVEQNRAARPYGGPNTGFEILAGAASVVPSVLKRIFGSTKFEFGKGKEDELNVDLIRHTNDDFIRNELPSIRSEEDLASHIEGLYGKGNTKVGEVPTLDDISRNRANLYYTRERNPGSPVLRPSATPNQMQPNNY